MPDPENPIAQTFDSRNPDALRRRNIDPRSLLRSKSITPDLLSDAIYGRTEVDQPPGYHSEEQKTALENGKAPEVARSDHSHDLTYLHEGLARDRAASDADWSDRILSTDAGVAPPYDRPERRMVLWTFDPDRPFASSPVLVYCSMSLDAGVTWGNYDLVGAGAPNTDCLIYEAVQWPWADTTNTKARYRVMLPKVDRSGAMKLVRTGSDGKLDKDFLPASVPTAVPVPVAQGGTGATNPTDAAANLEVQKTSQKDAPSGYAGLDANSRTTKGVKTTDDVIIDLATKGLVLKDTAAPAHYWRLSISTLGVPSWADLGTTAP